jgi:hypothetical protein
MTTAVLERQQNQKNDFDVLFLQDMNSLLTVRD